VERGKSSVADYTVEQPKKREEGGKGGINRKGKVSDGGSNGVRKGTGGYRGGLGLS